MKNPLTKMTAAAILLIVFIVLFYSTGQSSVAWGKILDRIARINSFTYHHQWTITEEQKKPGVIESTVYMSQAYGIRQDMIVSGKPFCTIYVPKDSHVKPHGSVLWPIAAGL